MDDDWAQTAADEIIGDLLNRRGLSQEFEQCDGDIQQEIRTVWAEIIRRIASTDKPA